jgi:uncharacterized protein YggT (Ycf19 family)
MHPVSCIFLQRSWAVKSFFLNVLDWTIQAYILLIVLRVFLSWGFLPIRYWRWLIRLTEPVLAPVRRLLRRSAVATAIDFSPAIVVLLLVFLRRWLRSWLGG